MKLVISSPSYHPASGGIRVLHYLGFLAKKNGHQVKMTCDYLNPEWGGYSEDLSCPDLTIIPEIDPPSSPCMGNVVRWVLYFPGVLCGGPNIYPDHELVVSYHLAYDQAAKEATPRGQIMTFTLPFCDLGEASTDIPRELRSVKNAVWYGKGARVLTPYLLSAIEITRNYPESRSELLSLLRNTRRVYSFDRHTALNDEAFLCGCEVLVWSGSEFVTHVNHDAANSVMNVERDTVSVGHFLRELSSSFLDSIM